MYNSKCSLTQQEVPGQLVLLVQLVDPLPVAEEGEGRVGRGEAGSARVRVIARPRLRTRRTGRGGGGCSD